MRSATPLDFLRGAAPGTRVVVRYRIDDGVTDALGYLISLDATECTVRTRRGDVVVPLDRVEAAKEVPPPPAPRAPRHPAP
ncbi:hypothetical protein [Arthrobacter sp. VKM Ac-2550]|uniref:putative acetyltransferase n=1 Tax=Crystallibacter permensis TaxID=1938888 RepID=UPI002226C640|nr:hypothetical protein [Arthrobacter sp. VKM Ac-2550]